MVVFFLSMLGWLIQMMGILLGVAFLTLLERNVLSLIQGRKGPNKVGLVGLLQPFSDGIKLFSSESVNPLTSNFFIYYMVTVMSLFLSLVLWLVIPLVGGLLDFKLGVIFFFCLTSISVYGIVMAGWSSNSGYSMLGSLRSVAQMISYEVSLILILLGVMVMMESFSLLDCSQYQDIFWVIFISIIIVVMWMITFLAEVNRTPFDLSEGESELVSGFNIEYGGGKFAFIFLAEYSSILFMSAFTVVVFLGGVDSDWYFFSVVVLAYWVIWVRGTLPRIRYDKLMYMAWKYFLLVSLMNLSFYAGFVGFMK